MTFRKDINGLRAIAVLAVVLFHFKIAGFTGGFAGVDVFFVISGYLMTAIIFNRIRNNKLSILDFYIARARRIIPALATLCIVLMVLGFFFLQVSDYRELLRDTKASLLFFSNIYYGKEFDYFSTPPQENWLLHTWSLSVEWQFYLAYPIIVALLCKFLKEPWVKIILVIGAVLSLTGASIYVHHNPTNTFYLLQTRAWEMLAGGLVFLFPFAFGKKVSFSLELIGLALVIFTIFYFTEATPWPSHLTLIPVLGTALVLYGNRESFITSNPICQFFGKISYSLYLWHWPIAVFLYYCGLSEAPLFIIMGIIVAIILATLSYYLVERFFLRGQIGRYLTLTKYLTLVILLGGVAAPSIASLVKKYKTETTSSTAQYIFNYKKQCNIDVNLVADCELGEGEATAIVIGDSHTESIVNAVQLANPQKTLLWSRGGCPILDTFKFRSSSETLICNQYVNNTLQRLETSYPNVPVIVVNRASLYIDPADVGGHLVSFYGADTDNRKKYLQIYRAIYIRTLCKIAEKRPVYILQPIPEMRTNVLKSLQMQKHFMQNLTDINVPLVQYYERQKFMLESMNMAQQQCGIKLLDPVPFLCPDGEVCMGSKDGTPLYYDDNHINDQGSELLIPLFKPIFTKP